MTALNIQRDKKMTDPTGRGTPPPLPPHRCPVSWQNQGMKVRKHELLLHRLPNHILNESFHPCHVLQHMLVRLSQFALYEDIRQQALTDGQWLSPPLSATYRSSTPRTGPVIVHPTFAVFPSIVVMGAMPISAVAFFVPFRATDCRSVWVLIVEDAQMYSSSVALVRHCDLSRKQQTGNRKLDRQRHEHRRRIVDPQRSRKREPQVRRPSDMQVYLQIRLFRSISSIRWY